MMMSAPSGRGSPVSTPKSITPAVLQPDVRVDERTLAVEERDAHDHRLVAHRLGLDVQRRPAGMSNASRSCHAQRRRSWPITWNER
jgi:hypothetical protein